jgi:hypothetical protein
MIVTIQQALLPAMRIRVGSGFPTSIRTKGPGPSAKARFRYSDVIGVGFQSAAVMEHSRIENNMKPANTIFVAIAFSVLADILIKVLIPDRVMNAAFIVTLSIVLLGVLLVAFGTVTKNGWGINLKPVNCPACGSPMPQGRQPKSLRQRLWGGWDCEKCGCEMDKWGRSVPPTR